DVTTWVYDAGTGLLLSKIDVANQATVYTYNSAGLLATRTWARGIVTTYSYDSWNQLTSTSYSDPTPAVSRSYDLLGRLISVTDSAGTTSKTYDSYGNVATETLSKDGETHLITELYDSFGRPSGYTYSRDSVTLQTAGTAYDAATGRIATANFVHGNETKTFAYNYLAGTDLLESLACPNGLTLGNAYDADRDLLTGISICRGETELLSRAYSYDSLGRPTARSVSRNGITRNDSFGYNSRSELVSATLGNDSYAYAFDNVGNRQTATEAGTSSAYSVNNLNQYQAIVETTAGTPVYFTPIHDADGNAILVRTATGTWIVAYNAENRPVRFENWGTDMVVEMVYDSQGRRVEKKVSVAGTTVSYHRYVYRGYLQIAAFDLLGASHPALRFVLWDPSQPTATRPLAIQQGGTWFTYGYDLTKNICEVFDALGNICTTYDYAPFGSVTSSGNISQPFQWSSEFYDSELALVYYNYRHYSPYDGRFLSRDPIKEQGGWNLYAFVKNNLVKLIDFLGLKEDYTHRTIKCKKPDSCPLLKIKATQWILHYSKRQQELSLDKYDLKNKNPIKYNNHIDKIEEAHKNALVCIEILIKKINDCKCGNNPPKVPTFSPKSLPTKVLILKNNHDEIDFEKIGMGLLWGGIAVGLLLLPFDGPVGETIAAGIAIGYITEGIYEEK
ncbi:MAG: hypothetical protein K6B46_00110, partial [Opitutales bacterium]|nr:hypothetical protein [Opitutales bacterium]